MNYGRFQVPSSSHSPVHLSQMLLRVGKLSEANGESESDEAQSTSQGKYTEYTKVNDINPLTLSKRQAWADDNKNKKIFKNVKILEFSDYLEPS